MRVQTAAITDIKHAFFLRLPVWKQRNVLDSELERRHISYLLPTNSLLFGDTNQIGKGLETFFCVNLISTWKMRNGLVSPTSCNILLN